MPCIMLVEENCHLIEIIGELFSISYRVSDKKLILTQGLLSTYSGSTNYSVIKRLRWCRSHYNWHLADFEQKISSFKRPTITICSETAWCLVSPGHTFSTEIQRKQDFPANRPWDIARNKCLEGSMSSSGTINMRIDINSRDTCPMPGLVQWDFLDPLLFNKNSHNNSVINYSWDYLDSLPLMLSSDLSPNIWNINFSGYQTWGRNMANK